MSVLNEQAILVHVPGVAKTLGSLQISPETAFLLSRLDGKTDLATISFMSGMEVSKAIDLLQPLMNRGLLKIIGSTQSEKKIGSMLDLLEHEESDPKYSKIPRELRREVLLLFSRLPEMNHFEILDLGKNANDEEIKANYFTLSKKYHPDRFFAEEVGHYRQKVSRIFEKINQAYEALGDQEKRQAYQKSLDVATGKAAPKSAPRESPLVANMNRARRYYQWGEEDYQRGNYISAASNFLLAINFDKNNEEYARAYGRVKPFIERKRVGEMMGKIEEKLEIADYEGALTLMHQLEAASPQAVAQDADFLSKIARIGLIAGLDVEKCSEYNRRAKEITGETVNQLITAGLILEKKNNPKVALTTYKRALAMEPGNAEVERAIQRLEKKK